MKISLSPMRRDDALSVIKDGDKLQINGEAFGFGDLPDGGTYPAGGVPSEWIVGPVERIDGEIHLTLILPHGPSPSEAVAFPAPIIDPPDGPLELPRDPDPEPVIEEEAPHVDA